jgi:hypothetical protein
MQHVPTDVIFHIFSFFSYRSAPTISLVCREWNELLQKDERTEFWKVWYHERVNESLATCKQRSIKKLRKKLYHKKRSEKILLLCLIQHQKAKQLQKELVNCNWSQFFPLIRKDVKMSKYLFHYFPVGRLMISCMILKLATAVEFKNEEKSKRDKLALHAMRAMVEKYGATFPNEKHLQIMRQKYPYFSAVHNCTVAPLHMALRYGFMKTAKAISKLSPVVTVHHWIPEYRQASGDRALQQVVYAIRFGHTDDPSAMIKFVIEDLKEPVDITERETLKHYVSIANYLLNH